ncbi:GGDEF domain-containing protein [Paractinoplanes rishiriensis]|uniref:GGDEF domain-containing protein n=1 Tax=Paractinoplanes rishiriensis TaxID=1050105 RepID=A0A919JYB6_9ACTN|nr:GGDEF domain-containing protein [Actinoplanes rishiriensis]GIE97471.1 hypothetical protein Ari01nite_49360 [Actinoplanes rishiriensis]
MAELADVVDERRSGRWRREPGGDSGLLRLSFGVLGLGAFWFVLNLITPVGPPGLLWLCGPLAALVVAVNFWQVSRIVALPVPTRRFWRHIAVAAMLVAAGKTVQALGIFRQPGSNGVDNIPAYLVLSSLAMSVVIFALFRLPIAARTRSERLRFMLDSATVTTGAGIFIWHFDTRLSLAANDARALLIRGLLMVLALVVVLAVAKTMLVGREFVDRSALRWLALAIFVGATGTLLRPLIPVDRSFLEVTQVTVPVIMCLGGWAAHRQRAAAVGGATTTEGDRRRSYSLLPYGAVAAVDALLVVLALVGDHSDQIAVVMGAVFLTALVMARQVLVLRENSRLLTRLDHSATHDALTGLPNRALLEKRLERSLAAADDRLVTVALIDLDDFKEINDTLGHDAGDQMLIEFARRLAGCVRDGDTVARLGGDEFVAVLDGADRAEADRVAGRMVAALRPATTIDGHDVPLRASIGLATGRAGDDAAVLRRRADVAMYLAKEVDGTAYLHHEKNKTGESRRPEPAGSGGGRGR